MISEKTLVEIYGEAQALAQKERYEGLKNKFCDIFGCEDGLRYFSAPGRTEVGGNHTDHNNGRVLAAAVNLDVVSVVKATDDNVIEFHSEGFSPDKIDISKLEVVEEEKNTSAALIRGVCKGFVNRGYKIGGFKAYSNSSVLKGSGLSSSAAFEVLVGTILNSLYNEEKVSREEIAIISQYAENKYFGKPSGLMDQMASSVGGFIMIDFKDTQNPVIEAINFDFKKSGYSLCIVDTKGNHADLTPEYAAMPVEMKSVAAFFGKSVLREVEKEDVINNLPTLRELCGDRAVLRALHFYDENERVLRERNALERNDFEEFLKVVIESGNSSYRYLQNVYANCSPKEQGLSVALYFAEQILRDNGGFRVHGGGLAGTIQAFVPKNKLSEFKTTLENIFGEGSVYVLDVRPFGGVEVK